MKNVIGQVGAAGSASARPLNRHTHNEPVPLIITIIVIFTYKLNTGLRTVRPVGSAQVSIDQTMARMHVVWSCHVDESDDKSKRPIRARLPKPCRVVRSRQRLGRRIVGSIPVGSYARTMMWGRRMMTPKHSGSSLGSDIEKQGVRDG